MRLLIGALASYAGFYLWFRWSARQQKPDIEIEASLQSGESILHRWRPLGGTVEWILTTERLVRLVERPTKLLLAFDPINYFVRRFAASNEQ